MFPNFGFSDVFALLDWGYGFGRRMKISEMASSSHPQKHSKIPHLSLVKFALTPWSWRSLQGFSSVKLLFPPFCTPSLSHLLSHSFKISIMTVLLQTSRIHNPYHGKGIIWKELCIHSSPHTLDKYDHLDFIWKLRLMGIKQCLLIKSTNSSPWISGSQTHALTLPDWPFIYPKNNVSESEAINSRHCF